MGEVMRKFSFTEAKAVIVLVSLPFLSACQGYGSIYNVAKPSELTVDQALDNIGSGLAKMRNRIQDGKGKQVGLLVDEVQVTLNVTADAHRKDTLVIDASAPILISPAAGKGEIKATNTSENSDNASRSNQITIKFKNWYTAQLNQCATSAVGPKPGDVLLDQVAKPGCK
jgi:hypothetical protein